MENWYKNILLVEIGDICDRIESHDWTLFQNDNSLGHFSCFWLSIEQVTDFQEMWIDLMGISVKCNSFV